VFFFKLFIKKKFLFQLDSLLLVCINECDSDSKKMVFLTKAYGYQKLCDTNKNVIKMGMIARGVYCISFLSTLKTFGKEVFHLFQVTAK
jgi:predicted metal-binding membrane protein